MPQPNPPDGGELVDLRVNLKFILWINNFLADLSQQVRFSSAPFPAKIINTDAPQGFVNSPNLHTLYINDKHLLQLAPTLKHQGVTFWRKTIDYRFSSSCRQILMLCVGEGHEWPTQIISIWRAEDETQESTKRFHFPKFNNLSTQETQKDMVIHFRRIKTLV